MTDHSTLLRCIPLFADLPSADITRISDLVQTQRCKAKETIVRQGDTSADLYVIVSGHVKVVASDVDGRDAGLNIQGPSEVFGEMALLDGAARSATIVALEPVELLMIPQAGFLAFLERQPKTAIKLLAVLVGRLRALTERAEDIAFLRVAARLAKRVVQLADRYGKADDNGSIRIVFKLSQQEIGDLVGATRESANKHIRRWEIQGLVSQEAGHLVIHRMEILRELGDG